MSQKHRLAVATRNAGKLREFAALLGDLPVDLVSPADYVRLELPPEEAGSYAANALTKARTVAAATGLVALADDSGLEVKALGGRPGVCSARFAGEGAGDAANNEKLLALLKEVPWEERVARFRCVLALVLPPGVELSGQARAIPPETVVEGICEGIIAFEPRGEHGFGYDPLFYLPAYGCTMAELSETVKNRVSHRARAFARLRPLLEQIFLPPGDDWRVKVGPGAGTDD